MNAYDWSIVDDEPWTVGAPPFTHRYILRRPVEPDDIEPSHTRVAVFLVAAALVAVLLLRRTRG